MDASQTGNENTQTQTNSGNENTSTQTDGQVTMKQEDLNTLINSKFAKGAEKAKKELLESLGVENEDVLKEILEAKKAQDDANKTELEKLKEQLDTIQKEKDEIAQDLDSTKKKASLNSMAAKHGVKEIDFFDMELRKAQKDEGFNEDEFIESLKKSKPFVFGQSVNTDNSSNSGDEPKSLKDKVKGLSFEELRALSNNI